jgi:D-alanyl-lipoteichoic acid acyltransferase DltB (MBOAT superfamily)
MAMAAALALGIRIPANFNGPYQARSIVDFWRRWHITLSSFITTYLYTPMVRSMGKVTFGKAMLATFAAMVIAGLWHGSSWGFIVFGALHGIGLVVNQYRKKAKHRKLPDGLAWVLTLAYVNVAFIFFRAPSLPDAFEVLRSLVDLRSIAGTETIAQSMGVSVKEIAIPVLLGIALVFSKKTSQQAAAEFTPSLRNLSWAASAMLVSLFYLNSNMAKQFLYFDF